MFRIGHTDLRPFGRMLAAVRFLARLHPGVRITTARNSKIDFKIYGT
jgi:hypothetical protein